MQLTGKELGIKQAVKLILEELEREISSYIAHHYIPNPIILLA